MVARDGQKPASLPRPLPGDTGKAGRHARYPRRADILARVTLPGSMRLPVGNTVFSSVFQPWSQATDRPPRPFGGRCPAIRARQAGTCGIHGEPTSRPGLRCRDQRVCPLLRPCLPRCFNHGRKGREDPRVPSEAAARRHGHGRQARVVSTESRHAGPGYAARTNAFARC